MKTIGVVPAYGRDYKSKREVFAAIDAGKDFIISDFLDPWEGKPINKAGAREAGYQAMRVRYDGKRKQAIFPLHLPPIVGAK